MMSYAVVFGVSRRKTAVSSKIVLLPSKMEHIVVDHVGRKISILSWELEINHVSIGVESCYLGFDPRDHGQRHEQPDKNGTFPRRRAFYWRNAFRLPL